MRTRAYNTRFAGYRPGSVGLRQNQANRSNLPGPQDAEQTTDLPSPCRCSRAPLALFLLGGSIIGTAFGIALFP